MVIPALGLVEHDRHRGTIEPARERVAFDTARRIIEEVEDREAAKEAPPARAAPKLCIVGAHDEADHLAGLALARALPRADFDAHVIGYPVLAAEIAEQVESQGTRLVCISAVPPHAVMQAGYLARGALRLEAW